MFLVKIIFDVWHEILLEYIHFQLVSYFELIINANENIEYAFSWFPMYFLYISMHSKVAEASQVKPIYLRCGRIKAQTEDASITNKSLHQTSDLCFWSYIFLFSTFQLQWCRCHSFQAGTIIVWWILLPCGRNQGVTVD